MTSSYDPVVTDPPLLNRYTQIVDLETSRATYKNLRVFYRKHQQAEQLPTEPAPIPLLVFIHGLGGSVAQFNKLLTSLTPTAPCLALDLPGCGRSEFNVASWEAYTTDALIELLEIVINKYREDGQRVILIGHSMGSSLAALLANPRTPSKSSVAKDVLGLVAICPPASLPSNLKVAKLALSIPDFIFNLFRAWDRRGGLESASVRRFLGPKADSESKRLQNLYNWQSRTPVWRRMALGALPKSSQNGGGMATPEEWAGLEIPVFLIGGSADTVTPPNDVQKIGALLKGKVDPSDVKPTEGEGIVDSAAPVDTRAVNLAEALNNNTNNNTRDQSTPLSSSPSTASSPPPEQQTPSSPVQNPNPPPIPDLNLHPKKQVKCTIIPEAGHGLLFTAPTLPALISDFLTDHITKRLSLAWQLQFLSRDGKWDVKNYEKWRKVKPVSDDIAGVFRAIKTLRGPDDIHCPKRFIEDWGDVIKDVIDISHDNPAYDPSLLREGGIRYHKFATLSKVPPNDEEIKGFIRLVDGIREEKKKLRGGEGEEEEGVIGVHCHYGFNRTGFLLVCYLVERCGFSTKDAIQAFAEARPDGIRHAHFRDRLYLRYAGGTMGEGETQ
ncbi:hypothetical protein QBC38DRAFT_145067 [Podospora fimiseda]|uniref:Tyrosine specific protein phosphatases domain-containing protein n=1 Tax=Podospora fimiseda TaxID=252190 RepID=A0AAN7BYP0_9PEZI|nr:hypothetical protein QBC38DRAFT_145067 [Podospora fimiseda]